jgi:hypothetical protein
LTRSEIQGETDARGWVDAAFDRVPLVSADDRLLRSKDFRTLGNR